MLEIFIFLQKEISLERKTQHAVITHASTSNGIKIPNFFGKSWGMMLYLSSAPKSSTTSDSVSAYLGKSFSQFSQGLKSLVHKAKYFLVPIFS